MPQDFYQGPDVIGPECRQRPQCLFCLPPGVVAQLLPAQLDCATGVLCSRGLLGFTRGVLLRLLVEPGVD